MALSDMSAQASQIYRQRLSEMTPSERVGLGVRFWEAAKSLQGAAIRLKKPGAGEAEINFEIAVFRFSIELAHVASAS